MLNMFSCAHMENECAVRVGWLRDKSHVNALVACKDLCRDIGNGNSRIDLMRTIPAEHAEDFPVAIFHCHGGVL